MGIILNVEEEGRKMSQRDVMVKKRQDDRKDGRSQEMWVTFV